MKMDGRDYAPVFMGSPQTSLMCPHKTSVFCGVNLWGKLINSAAIEVDEA